MSIVFSDLNYDSIPEIIASNDLGDLYVLNIDNEFYSHFPISYDFPYSSFIRVPLPIICLNSVIEPILESKIINLQV